MEHMETKVMHMSGKESTRTAIRDNMSSSHSPPSPSGGVGQHNRCLIATIVYFALLLDNMLLTVIVPILPAYLETLNANEYGRTKPAPMNGTFHVDIIKHPILSKSEINFTLDNVPRERRASMLKPLPHTAPANDPYTGRAFNRILHTNRLNYSLYNNNNNNHSAVGINGPDVNERATNDKLSSENGSIGLLLAVKAFVELLVNPFVGSISSKFGYRLPIIVGTFFLLLSSLIFAIGETYFTLLLARAIQGVASACISICGMSLVAQHYPEKERRSKVMGIILGSIALGVLIGYPFGSILYDLVGKSAPFVILSSIIFLNLGLQLLTLDMSIEAQPTLNTEYGTGQSKWKHLLTDKIIMALVLAIWFSTSTMAILEPCLPVWLMENLKPSKWQLGTVFIPDSVGYFVGTNFFGGIAYKYGQVKIACLSLLLVGISSTLIPSAQTVSQLLFPHFGLGLGIGVIDAALVPLLATIVDVTLAADDDEESDENTVSTYGTIYAIQQTSVSLAYCLAPLLGGFLAGTVGFTWLMRIVGCVNIIYGPILVFIYQRHDAKDFHEKRNELLILSDSRKQPSQYKQLYNSVDIE